MRLGLGLGRLGGGGGLRRGRNRVQNPVDGSVVTEVGRGHKPGFKHRGRQHDALPVKLPKHRGEPPGFLGFRTDLIDDGSLGKEHGEQRPGPPDEVGHSLAFQRRVQSTRNRVSHRIDLAIHIVVGTL